MARSRSALKELHGGDLDQVRQGLRMAAPPDPERLADEKRVLAELDPVDGRDGDAAGTT